MIELCHHRIVITGGDGFLGRHLQLELVRRGVPQENLLIPLRQDYDLTNEGDVSRVYSEMKPDIVIHLAAEVGGIGANMKSPGRFFYANMAMGMHLIEQARIHGVVKFVQVGTICAYPKFTPVPFCEESLWDGYPEETNAPYGIAKKSLLVMLQAYRKQYGLSGIYLLPVNLYGPGDNFNLDTSHVIPAMIRKFSEARAKGHEVVTLWGTGSASREFFHVEDCARGIADATEKYDRPEPVNLGCGSEITIAALASMIRKRTGFQGKVEWDPSKPDGQPRRCLDVSRAAMLFGFAAGIDLEEGLSQTIEWYLEHSNSIE